MTDLQPENAYPRKLIAQIADAVGITDPAKISALARGLREMPDLAAAEGIAVSTERGAWVYEFLAPWDWRRR